MKFGQIVKGFALDLKLLRDFRGMIKGEWLNLGTSTVFLL